MAAEDITKQDPATPGPPAPAPAPALAYIDKNDDIYDTPEELQGNSLLARGLRILAEICSPYWHANHEAMILQDEHRRITFWALVAATFAVMMAIGQLPYLKLLEGPTEWIVVAVESLAALSALVLVYRGIKLSVQKRWLLERHKAERFRFLKFRWLLDLLTKSNDDPDLARWKRLASAEALVILGMEETDLEQWMTEHHRVAKDDKSLQSVVPEKDFDEIVNFYKRKRLDRQVSYFYKKSKATLEGDWLTKLLPPILFLASLAMALIHFGIDIVDAVASALTKSEVTAGKEYSVWFITLAAFLPVLGAAIRTHRSANEYSRNTVRFSAVYRELKEASDELPNSRDTTAKLRSVWQSEENLEDEHREWLRLMDDAEWYG
jgi:hypothetical protein